jgi:dTDP-4-amino-4,6-dideoxygalactose transaminase
MIEHSMPTIAKEEIEAVIRVMKSRYLAEGEVVTRFEDELSSYIGSKGGVATSTGTLALHLALVSLGIGENDEVIIPNYVCRSVLNSVLYSGAKPVLSDINENDYNISFESAKNKISRKTKAVIIPHMFGYPAEIDKFKNLGIYIIEDCAHSVGAEYKGRRTGNWGDLSIFSFEGTKYMITGEGGMVLANSVSLLNSLRKLKKPDSADGRIKYTYRMTNLQAAIGRVQLSKLTWFIKRRRQIAKAYDNAFCHFDVDFPAMNPDRLSVFHRYMLNIKRDITSFISRCYKKGVKVKQPVKPFLLNRYLGLSGTNYPNSRRILKSAVSIPIYPSLTDKELKLIINVVSSELKKL